MTTLSRRLPITVDPLIAEANRRKRLRRLTLAAVLVGVVAVAVPLALRPSGGYPAGWIPQGVQEIEVSSLTRLASGKPAVPAIRITDPSKVNQVIGWFDALVTARVTTAGCQGGAVANMTFTFRSANGRPLGTANSNPYGASGCSPTYLTAGTQSVSLMDGTDEDPFVGRVARLLGVKFPMSPIRG